MKTATAWHVGRVPSPRMIAQRGEGTPPAIKTAPALPRP